MVCCPCCDHSRVCASLTELKRNLMAAPFDRAFDALREGRGGSVPPAAIPWRKNEFVYLVPQVCTPSMLSSRLKEQWHRMFCLVFFVCFCTRISYTLKNIMVPLLCLVQILYMFVFFA